MPAYFGLYEVEAGAEFNKRDGNKIYLRNVRIQLAIKATSTYNNFRIMVVQSKQGMLAGGYGSTDSPGIYGLADCNKCRLLYDELHSSNVTGGAGTVITQPFMTVNLNVKIASVLRYKQGSYNNFECDKPVYVE